MRTLKSLISILLFIILLPAVSVLAQAENKDTASENIKVAEITTDPAPDPCFKVLRWYEREQKINDSLSYVIAMERTEHGKEVDSFLIVNLNLNAIIEKQKTEKQTQTAEAPKQSEKQSAVGADPLLSDLKQKNSALIAEKDALNKRINTVEKEKNDLQKKADEAENKRAKTDSLLGVSLFSQIRSLDDFKRVILERDSSVEKITAVSLQADDLSNEIKRQKEKNDTLVNKITTCSVYLTDALTREKAKADELDSIMAELQMTRGDVQSFRESFHSCKKQYEDGLKETEDLLKEVEIYRKFIPGDASASKKVEVEVKTEQEPKSVQPPPDDSEESEGDWPEFEE